MKICFITPSTGTIQGGAETTVRQFAKHLAKKHEVTLLTGKSPHKPLQEEILDPQYEVLTTPYWPRFTPLNNIVSKLISRLTPYKTESFSFYYNVLLRSKIKRRIKDMDIISTHYWLDSRLFSNLALKLNVPSVFHILGGPYSKEFFEADKSTTYVAVSKGTQTLINKTHNINIEDVVTPGIPSNIFLDDEVGSDKEGPPSLLFVGRLQPSKGVYDLIEIFSGLIKKHSPLKLTIVGEGDILKELKEKVTKHNLHGKVIFTGAVPYDEVFKYYRSSTILVFPTKNEVFPLVSIEAMACGIPVVTSDIPSLRESTGGNAVLLPPKDLDAWVDTINQLLENKRQREELVLKGIKWAKEFTWEKKAAEYEKALIKAREIFKKRTG